MSVVRKRSQFSRRSSDWPTDSASSNSTQMSAKVRWKSSSGFMDHCHHGGLVEELQRPLSSGGDLAQGEHPDEVAAGPAEPGPDRRQLVVEAVSQELGPRHAVGEQVATGGAPGGRGGIRRGLAGGGDQVRRVTL